MLDRESRPCVPLSVLLGPASRPRDRHGLEVIIDAVFVRPKSHMTKRGVRATAPTLPRPDVDNVAKAVLDALQDVIGDDTHVRRLVVEKSYGTEARTTVRIQ
ncbi:RusA family crossover junction endodeoxyribonuclease [bacterium]|nr:RusA family crossover junction endodeoxyribonuclease [bacterium]